MNDKKHESPIKYTPVDILSNIADYLSLNDLLLVLCLVCKNFKNLIMEGKRNIFIFNKFTNIFYGVIYNHMEKEEFNSQNSRVAILGGLKFFKLAKKEKNEEKKLNLYIESIRNGNPKATDEMNADFDIDILNANDNIFNSFANFYVKSLHRLEIKHPDYQQKLKVMMVLSSERNLNNETMESICRLLLKFISSERFSLILTQIENVDQEEYLYLGSCIECYFSEYIRFAVSNHAILSRHLADRTDINPKAHRFLQEILQIDTLKTIATQSINLTQTILGNIDSIGVEIFAQIITGEHDICDFIDQHCRKYLSIRSELSAKRLYYDKIKNSIKNSLLLSTDASIIEPLSYLVILLNIPVLHPEISTLLPAEAFPLFSYTAYAAVLHYLKNSPFREGKEEWLEKQLELLKERSDKFHIPEISDLLDEQKESKGLRFRCKRW